MINDVSIYKKAFFNLCDYGFFNIDNSYDDISFSYEFYLKYNNNMKLNIVLNKDEQYILSLISGILSLYLDTENKCQIYNPALVYTDGQTSFSTDNIPMPLLECLYEEAENRITNYHILSRFFDIMWVVKCFKGKQNYIVGKKANEYYEKLLLDLLKTNNVRFAREIFVRKNSLILELGQRFEGRERHFDIFTDVLKTIPTSQNIHFLYKVWDIASTISFREEIYQDICVKIEDYIKIETNLNWIENCINLLCRLYIKMEKYDEHRTILEKLASIYEEYASNVDRTFMKISYLSQAIEALHRIKNNPDDDKIKKLYCEIQTLQNQPDTTLHKFSEKIDITDEVEALLNKCKGYNFSMLLYELWISKNYFPDKEYIENQISSKQTLLTDIIPVSYQNHLGQTVEEDEGTFALYNLQKSYMGLVYNMRIKPILALLNQRYFYTEDSFRNLLNYNPIIPEGYEVMFAKGVYYFIKGLYIEAASILVPLVENSFRNIISIDSPTIHKKNNEEIFENKIEMSSLIREVSSKNLLDNILLYYLDVIFNDKKYNIRNYVAHGLYPYQMFYTEDMGILLFIIYALVFEPIGNKILDERKKIFVNNTSQA